MGSGKSALLELNAACTRSALLQVQKSIADGNGSQCGFCTPGWVMNMYSLLSENKDLTAEQIEQNFDGNLCRCTGTPRPSRWADASTRKLCRGWGNRERGTGAPQSSPLSCILVAVAHTQISPPRAP